MTSMNLLEEAMPPIPLPTFPALAMNMQIATQYLAAMSVHTDRYMSSMREPSKFSRAAVVALTAMFWLYLAIACVAYALLGKDIPTELPLTSLLPQVLFCLEWTKPFL
jgi:hypothetical protein